MLSSCFILLLASASSFAFLNAASSNSLTEMFSRNDPRLSVSTGLAETDMDGLKFIVQYQDATDAKIGNGVIINKYFSLTLKSVVSSFEASATGLTVYARCLTPSPSCTTGEIRLAKAVIANSACGTALRDCISLVRTCPSWPTTYTALPFVADADLATYRLPATTVNLYQNDNADLLSKAVKNIGELCECMDIAGWEVAYHVCLSYDATIFGESTDLNGLIVTDSTTSTVVGFLVSAPPNPNSAEDGEIILHLGHSDYDTWIGINSDFTAFEYP